MTAKPKVWIDPEDCGLATVEAAEEKRRQEAERQCRAERKQQLKEERLKKKEEEARERTQALATQTRQEILPPGPKVAALSLPDTSSLALPDLSGVERQIRQAADMLDLRKPEGWLDSWFDRPDHRLDVKTQRGQRLAGYIAACTAILEEARRATETVGALQRAKYQLYLDQLIFVRSGAEEHCQLELTRRRAERQDAIEAAQAKEAIDAHGGNSREHGLRGRPLPPAAPAPPPPPPVDEATRQKEEARRARKEMQELELDERAEGAQFEQELVSKARTEAIKVYQNLRMLAGDRFERIRRVLDSYEVPVTILPEAIQEFMQEEEEASSL